MTKVGSTEAQQPAPHSVPKKLWTAPVVDTFAAASAENQLSGPNRGDGVTSCGS